MRLHLFTYLGSAVFTLGLMPGCAGGQTGDLSGEHADGTETGTVGGCEEHKQQLADFDAMTDAGTAEQVLAYAERSFEAPLSWKVAGELQSWSVGPETGTGVIHIDVTRGASAYQLTYTAKQNDSGIEVGVICPPPQLGVEVHVDVTTDGGALAESYDAMLRTSAPGVTTLSVPLDLTKLEGTLEVSHSKPRAKLVQMSLDATLTAEGTTGSISGTEQVDSGSGATGVSSASKAVLAVWPDSEACQALFQDGTGLGVSVEDEVLGVTGADTLASVATSTPAAVTWVDGTETTLTVDIQATGDGCFRVSNLPAEIGGGAAVSYPVTIIAKSADGRLDGAYVGQVVVTGSSANRLVIASSYLQLGADDVASSGFESATVPDDSDGLSLQFESRLEGDTASGSIRLFSVTNPPCLTEPQEPVPMPGGGASAPGCEGQSRTTLETAAWP